MGAEHRVGPYSARPPWNLSSPKNITQTFISRQAKNGGKLGKVVEKYE
jgi:hypothetical protein